MSNYKSKNHSKFTLKYHIIFVCKYRWFPSSKMCRFCGNINKELTLADRVWTCICGEVINRDENAAINIMNVGLNMV